MNKTPMSDLLKNVRDFMDSQGIPSRDAYDLPTSGKSFPDGAGFRIEIAGVERALTMEAMIEEAMHGHILATATLLGLYTRK